MQKPPCEEPAALIRWPVPAGMRVFRDTTVLHLKLILDGAKDVVIAPLALVAAVIDGIRGRGAEPLFYRVLRLDAAIGRWIDVYGDGSLAGLDELDDLIGRLETSSQAPREARSDRRKLRA